VPAKQLDYDDYGDDAELSGAELSGAELSGAELADAKFAVQLSNGTLTVLRLILFLLFFLHIF